MDKICRYIDNELYEIEDRISQGGKLSGAEIEYADKLAHLKKSILTNKAMEESYSGRYYRDNGQSMANNGGGRGGNSSRATNGRRRNYSRDEAREEFTEQLEDLMESAPDEITRRKVERLMNEMR